LHEDYPDVSEERARKTVQQLQERATLRRQRMRKKVSGARKEAQGCQKKASH
jgi:hypothetical protein